MDKIVFCDIDGTISSEVNSISKEVKAMLESGKLEFVLATGRNIKHARELNLNVPIISSNGAQIDYLDGSSEIIAGINEDVLTQIITDIRKDKYVFVVSCEHGNILEAQDEDTLDKLYSELASLHPELDHKIGRETYEEIIVKNTIGVGNVLDYLNSNNLKALKVEIFTSEDKVSLENKFNKYTGTYGYSSHVCNYEITPDNVSKAEGIKAYLANRENYRVYAVGDSSNDLEMFKFADESFAMENGITELKQLATHVVPSVDNDGFLSACEIILGE